MSLIHAAAVLASEEAATASHGVPAYVVGLFAFGVLVVGLIATMMINVNR
ncbi:MAG: hypothetical protein HQ453_10815 [Actinobacteria bacterium]|nr:hypothetical protein [Actinomycetota bacterium]